MQFLWLHWEVMNMFHCKWTQFPPHNEVYNKKLMLTAPTVHCALPFRIALCSVQFGWLGCCWTRSCTWVWRWLRGRKIFVYEAFEIAKQDGIIIHPYQKVIRYSRWKHKPATVDRIRKSSHPSPPSLLPWWLIVTGSKLTMHPFIPAISPKIIEIFLLLSK